MFWFRLSRKPPVAVLIPMALVLAGAPAHGVGRSSETWEATSTVCAPLQFIGVRGLGETAADYNGYGRTVSAVGKAVTSLIPNAALTEIDYPAASFAELLSHPETYEISVQAGESALVAYLNNLAGGPCSQVTKVILAGYSEGADVVGNVLTDRLTEAQQDSVASAVMLSDPAFNPNQTVVDRGTFDDLYGVIASLTQPRIVPPRLTSAVVSFCQRGDPICNASDTNLGTCWKHPESCSYAHYPDNKFDGVSYTTAAGGFLALRYSQTRNPRGTVWSWGLDGSGQLGDGHNTNSTLPVRVNRLTDALSVAGGDQAGYALRKSGRVWSWGDNFYGELGNGTTTASSVPVEVSGLTSVRAVASGSFTAYALRSDGTVWAWGLNQHGQLGIGLASNARVPVQVSGLSDVTAIAAGDSTAYALLSDGTVWSWGNGQYGALGNATITDSATPVEVDVSRLSGVTAIAAGAHTAVCPSLKWGPFIHGELEVSANRDRRIR